MPAGDLERRQLTRSQPAGRGRPGGSVSTRYLDAKPCGAEYSGPSGDQNDRLSRRTAMSPSSHTIGNTMNTVSSAVLERLRDDFDAREELLRQVVGDRLGQNPPPAVPDHVVATYYFAFRSQTLEKAVEEISYHATSGIKNPPKGSLLGACSARQAGVDAVRRVRADRPPARRVSAQDDAAARRAPDLVRHPAHRRRRGHLRHVREPGRPAGRAPDPRRRSSRPFPARPTGRSASATRPASHPTSPPSARSSSPRPGSRPTTSSGSSTRSPGSPLLMFIKEDEDLYPEPRLLAGRRANRRAIAAIERVRDRRGGLGLVYAPTSRGAPHEIVDTVHRRARGRGHGVMFSETYAGGTVRMVREATRHLPNPPAIYGHNAGIGVKTRRDLARGDRLPGPARRHRLPPDRAGPPRHAVHPSLRRRNGWPRRRPSRGRSPGINPTMITRAGALDQGNIILNLQDVEARGIAQNVLFLAGSAINSIKDKHGKTDPRLGLEAMIQAIEVHRSGELEGRPRWTNISGPWRRSPSGRTTALREASASVIRGKLS